MKRFALRLPDDLHEKLAERSESDHRSLNAEILYLLTAALNAPADEVDGWARHEQG